MARNLVTPIYSGSLKLDKITGVRLDKGQRKTPIQSLLKPNLELPKVVKSTKADTSTYRGKKYQ